MKTNINWRIVIICAGLLLLFSHLCQAQVDDASEEADNTTQEDSLREKKPTKKYKPKISGFIQTNYLEHFDTNGDGEKTPSRFRAQRVRIRVKGKITAKISYQVEIDPRAPDITGIMRDAYISFQHIPHHQIRIGQQKTQFGYENVVSSTKLFFVNRTDVSDNLSRGMNLRDVGIGLIGYIPINKNIRFEDAITLVNGAGMNVQADNNNKKSLWGRAGLRYKNDNLKWRAGLSGAKADILETEIDSVGTPYQYFINFNRLGVDFELEQKWFNVAAEYVVGKDNEPEEVADRKGYYCILIGKINKDFGPTLRYENVDDGEFTRWVAGVFYGRPTARVRVLLNYEIRKLTEDPELPFGEDNRFYAWLQVRF